MRVGVRYAHGHMHTRISVQLCGKTISGPVSWACCRPGPSPKCISCPDAPGRSGFRPASGPPERGVQLGRPGSPRVARARPGGGVAGRWVLGTAFLRGLGAQRLRRSSPGLTLPGSASVACCPPHWLLKA